MNNPKFRDHIYFPNNLIKNFLKNYKLEKFQEEKIFKKSFKKQNAK